MMSLPITKITFALICCSFLIWSTSSNVRFSWLNLPEKIDHKAKGNREGIGRFMQVCVVILKHEFSEYRNPSSIEGSLFI
jgi:hypothetical protein